MDSEIKGMSRSNLKTHVTTTMNISPSNCWLQNDVWKKYAYHTHTISNSTAIGWIVNFCNTLPRWIMKVLLALLYPVWVLAHAAGCTSNLAHASYGPCYSVPCMHASSCISSILSNLNFGASFGWQGAQVILAHASYGPCYSVPCMHASSCIYSILSNLNFGASFGWQGAHTFDGLCL